MTCIIDNSYNLPFISQEDFEQHVVNTIINYSESLKSINLNKFNSNLVDPIKLLFDKTVYKKTLEEIIELEIHRQRDKSNNNIIGYFHQNIFRYIKNCTVPSEGWDIIFEDDNVVYYVELKNKHNTMNSSSSAKTYMKMQNHLLNATDKDISICALVEVISKRSQNIPWVITLDKVQQLKNESLRRISIDKFYEIVTHEKNAFRMLCEQLPITLNKLIKNYNSLQVEEDTVISELMKLNSDMLLSLFQLSFQTYNGWEDCNDNSKN